jgi:lipopolysaccharide transport system permease protein
MTAAAIDKRVPALEITSDLSLAARQRRAALDVVEGVRLWRLIWTLGWLDIRLRYRGSVLGPFWLTLSTAVMVGSLGFLYATLWHINLHDFMPFIALSLVLWNAGIAGVVNDACTCFVSSEAMIRSMRMPFSLYPARAMVRNLLILAHNIVVIIAVYAIFRIWPGWHALMAIPAFLLWIIDGLAAGLLLGAFCARFRDIPPIVNSIVQIAFFVSAVIWQPSQLGVSQRWLPLNPFFSILEIMRAPLLGQVASAHTWEASIAYSLVFCALAWMMFARVRARLAFWV